MMRIGVLMWRGKCKSHPSYHPKHDPGPEPPECTRCALLREIHQKHSELIALLKRFGPLRMRKRKPAPVQLAMFDPPPEEPATNNLLEMKPSIDRKSFFRK